MEPHIISDFERQLKNIPNPKVMEPKTRDNPFIWLMLAAIIFSGFQVAQNYSGYTAMQSFRSLDVAYVKSQVPYINLPRHFTDQLGDINDQASYTALHNKISRQMKLMIGFYLALSVIALGLMYKDVVAVFSVLVFLGLVTAYKVMVELPMMIDLGLFAWLLLLMLTSKEFNK